VIEQRARGQRGAPSPFLFHFFFITAVNECDRARHIRVQADTSDRERVRMHPQGTDAKMRPKPSATGTSGVKKCRRECEACPPPLGSFFLYPLSFISLLLFRLTSEGGSGGGGTFEGGGCRGGAFECGGCGGGAFEGGVVVVGAFWGYCGRINS
jgi:hypothetical protein